MINSIGIDEFSDYSMVLEQLKITSGDSDLLNPKNP